MTRSIGLAVSLVALAPAIATAEDKTPKVIEAALGWLKRHQHPDGSWQAGGWSARCRAPACSSKGQERGEQSYVVGVTGLAVQAFVGAGHTHKAGAHRAVVAKALAYLQRQQRADGSIGFRPSHGESVYNHAIATQALAELYAASQDPALKGYAQRAANWCLRAQNPNLGWQYGVKTGRNDTSVTGWMVQALAAAARAKLFVPGEAFEGAKRWFVRATDNAGSVGYMTPGGGSALLPQNRKKYDKLPTMTAMSVYCRILCGDRRSEDAVRKGAKLIDVSPPLWKPRRIHGYYWLAGTRAMAEVGGSKRKDWNDALRVALNANQRAGGCADGSWDPLGEWCLAGGRVYFTAINALALQSSLRDALGQVEPASAPHGGKLVLTPKYVFEVLLESDEVVVYVADALGEPLELKDVKGVIQVSIHPEVKDVYRPLYKKRRGRKLSAKQRAKEMARRAKFDARMKEKKKPKVLEKDVERVPADKAAGRRVAYLRAPFRFGRKYAYVSVRVDLERLPGAKVRVTRVRESFRSTSKRVHYRCLPCKQRHVDPGPCVSCGKPVR